MRVIGAAADEVLLDIEGGGAIGGQPGSTLRFEWPDLAAIPGPVQMIRE
jgi:hypothetical protein